MAHFFVLTFVLCVQSSSCFLERVLLRCLHTLTQVLDSRNRGRRRLPRPGNPPRRSPISEHSIPSRAVLPAKPSGTLRLASLARSTDPLREHSTWHVFFSGSWESVRPTS